MRVCFTPLHEVLFTFPSRYWFAIGLSLVFSLTGWSPLVRPEFLVLRVTQVPTRFNNCIFVYGTITLCGYPFQNIPLINYYRSALVLQPRAMRCHIHGLGSSAFARHYLRNHCYFLFLWVLRCFSSPRSLTVCSVSRSNLDGLPHSDISGSMCICHSPKLFAAYHVLLRL